MQISTRHKPPTNHQLSEHLDVNRDRLIRLLVTPAEYAAWQAAADKAGLKLSEWIRRRVQGEMTVTAPPPPSRPYYDYFTPAAKAKIARGETPTEAESNAALQKYGEAQVARPTTTKRKGNK